MMKSMIGKILALLMLMMSISYAGTATLEKAQHRLPPVIYSLGIPKTIIANQDYNFEWSVMGYHDSYDVIVNVYDANGNKIIGKEVSPHSTTAGQYSWGEIRSKKFSYSVNVNLTFTNSQDLIVRFFARPLNDNIDDETFLSLLVPGGLGYEAGDSTGRKIKIYGSDSTVFLSSATIDNFVNNTAGTCNDVDGYYGCQCVDLMHLYIEDVLGVPRSEHNIRGNAYPIYRDFGSSKTITYGSRQVRLDKIANTPNGIPQKGDIIFWNSADGIGHVAIFIEGDVNRFQSLDQNWINFSADNGSSATLVEHVYTGSTYVVGWLRPVLLSD